MTLQKTSHFDYIQKCISKGITSFPKIHQQIKDEINEVNEKLASVEHLRLERNELLKIENVLSLMLRSDSIEDKFEDSSEEMQKIRKAVYETISTDDAASNRDIIMKLYNLDGSFYGSDAKIIRCIKYMADMGILDKNKERQIVKGPNWLKFQS